MLHDEDQKLYEKGLTIISEMIRGEKKIMHSLSETRMGEC